MGNLTIGEYTYGSVARRGDMNDITIGKFCSIATGVVCDSGFNHETKWISTYPFNSQLSLPVPHNAICKGDITIGNDVWICENVLIMSGVIIGDGAVIGANTIVTKDVEPYRIVAGSPNKVIKKRFEYSEIAQLMEMNWWHWDIDRIKEASPLLMSSDISGLYEFYKQNICK